MADYNSMNRSSYNPALVLPSDRVEKTQERDNPDMYTRIAELSKADRRAYIEALESKIESLRSELLIAYQVEHENSNGEC